MNFKRSSIRYSETPLPETGFRSRSSSELASCRLWLDCDRYYLRRRSHLAV